MLLIKTKENINNFDNDQVRLASLFLGVPSKEVLTYILGVKTLTKQELADYSAKHKLKRVYKKNVFYFEDNEVVFNIENVYPHFDYQLIVLIWGWLNEEEEAVESALELYTSSIALIEDEIVKHNNRMEQLVGNLYCSVVPNNFQVKKLAVQLKKLRINYKILDTKTISVHKNNIKYNTILYNNITLVVSKWKIISFKIKLGKITLDSEEKLPIRVHPLISVMDLPYGFNSALSWCIGNYEEYALGIKDIFYPENINHVTEEELKLNILKLKSAELST